VMGVTVREISTDFLVRTSDAKKPGGVEFLRERINPDEENWGDGANTEVRTKGRKTGWE